MSDTKGVQIKVVTDKGTIDVSVREVQRLAKALDGLKQVSHEVSRAFNGVFGTGSGSNGPVTGTGGTSVGGSGPRAGPVGGGIMKGFAETAKAIDQISAKTVQSSKALSDMAKRELAGQERAVESLNSELKSLHTTLESVRGMAGDKPNNFEQGLIGSIEEYARRAGTELDETTEKMSRLKKALGEKTSGSAAASQLFSGKGLAAALGVVGGAMIGAGELYNANRMMEQKNAIASGSAQSYMLHNYLRGDDRDYLYMNMTMPGSKTTYRDYMNNQVSGTGADKVIDWGKIGVGVASIVGGLFLTASTGGLGTPGGITAGAAGLGLIGTGLYGTASGTLDLLKGGPEAKQGNRQLEALQMARQQNPFVDSMIDQMYEEAPMRFSSSMALQGKHLGARSVGAGFGFDFGQSVGIAENISSRYGNSSLLGKTSYSTHTRTIPENVRQQRANEKFEATWGIAEKLWREKGIMLPGVQEFMMGNSPDSYEGNIMRKGYEKVYRKSFNEAEPKTEQFKTAHSTRGFLGDVMHMMTTGVNQGSAIGGIGGVMQAMMANNSSKKYLASGAEKDAYNVINNIQSQMAGRGITDGNLQSSLIETIGNSTMTGGGLNPDALMQYSYAMMNGVRNGDSATMQQNILGLQGFNAQSKGNQAYLANNMLLARKALGSKADVGSIESLANADIQELMGDGSKRVRSLGELAGVDSKEWMNRMHTLANQEVDTRLGGKLTAFAQSGKAGDRFLKAYREGGGAAALKGMNEKDLAQFANYYSPTNYEEGLGALRGLQGELLGTKGKPGTPETHADQSLVLRKMQERRIKLMRDFEKANPDDIGTQAVGPDGQPMRYTSGPNKDKLMSWKDALFESAMKIDEQKLKMGLTTDSSNQIANFLYATFQHVEFKDSAPKR